MRFLLFAAITSAVFFAVDLYVYSNWRRFARRRALARLRQGYAVLLWVMPLLLPVYASLSRWWEVEPKLLRAVALGLWFFWYVPKVPIALVLALKDVARFSTWLFGWFGRRLRPAPAAASARAQEAGLDLSDMKRLTRAEFLRQMGWTVAGVPFVVVGYGLFRGLYDFDVREVSVRIPGLPRALDGLRIVQLSDLHAGSLFSPRPMHDAVEIVGGLRPDLIAVTGDYVNNDAREAAVILPALARLRAPLGVYGCLGNHDHYADVRDVTSAVRSTAVELLVNEHRSLRVDGALLHLVGTDNTGFSQHFADLPRALDGLVAHPHGEEARILMAHDPTFWDGTVRPEHAGIDLTLSGHTHGGQIGFEFGPLRWGLARLVYDRWAGLYREPAGTDRAQFLYVNRGLGTVGAPLRIGIRPEITVLTLRNA